MNKNGFTVVELIAVVTILALLLIFVVPTITSSSQSVKERTYQTKKESIETSAILYGQDNYRTIVEGADEGKQGFGIESTEDVRYRTYTIQVKDLVPEYITADVEDAKGLISDPRDSSKYLDDYEIIIKINTNTRKVTAEFIDPDEE